MEQATSFISTCLWFISLQIQKDHSAPVYVINLFISDLIQLCCLAAWKAGELHDIIGYSYIFALISSVGFMVCISLER